MPARQSRTFLRRIKRRKFGELLLGQGTITQEQLDEALSLQKKDGGLLGEIMVQKGFISENEVARSLSTQYGLPVLRTREYEVDKEVLDKFSPQFLYVNLILPLGKIADLLLVAVCDLPPDSVIRELEEISQCEVVFYVSSVNDISDALTRYVPMSDDDLEEFASLRRKRGQKEATTQVSEQSSEEPVLTGESVFAELDNAWENIFDEAEQNLKKGGA